MTFLDLIKQLNINIITVGPIFESINSNQLKFTNTSNAQEYFKTNSFNEYLILLKGSRSVGLEKLENDL